MNRSAARPQSPIAGPGKHPGGRGTIRTGVLAALLSVLALMIVRRLRRSS